MKLDEFECRGSQQDIIDFKDQTTLILNNGSYSAIVVNTAPSWTARNGEFVFFNSANITRTYFYNNGVWNFLETSTAGGQVTTVSSNLNTVTTAVTNGALKGWINFNGIAAQLAIKDHFNVESVTREAAGNYTISWATTFATTAYPVVGMSMNTGPTATFGYVSMRSGGKYIGSTGILIWDRDGGSLLDNHDISVMVTGDQ